MMNKDQIDTLQFLNDYLDGSTEAKWIKPEPEQEFDAWETWTWAFSNTPF